MLRVISTAVYLSKKQLIGSISTIRAVSLLAGYFSWRNSAKGSWFVQALHRMIEKFGDRLDFVSLLTRVNYEVAYEFESNASQAHMTRKKQIPSIVSMLTKDLYLTPKPK